jgi:ATP-binding cassette subfamily B protein
VERGTHEQLLAAGGRYEELHRTQFAVQKNVAAEEQAGSGGDDGRFAKSGPR